MTEQLKEHFIKLGCKPSYGFENPNVRRALLRYIRNNEPKNLIYDQLKTISVDELLTYPTKYKPIFDQRNKTDVYAVLECPEFKQMILEQIICSNENTSS